MANYVDEVSNFENIRRKICEATAGMVVSTYEYLHFDKDPYSCGGDTFDFKRGADFDMIEPEAGDFSIDRGEVTSTQALKQTSASSEQSLEWSQEFPIKARYGDSLNTFLLRILMNEYKTNKGGKTIVAYSNQGISYTKKVVFNEGQADEFAVVMFFPYLKAESWPNVYLGDLTEESTVSLNVKIENFPVIEYEGTMPSWFGIPKDVTAPTVTFDTLTYDETNVVNIEGLTLLDPDMVAFEENMLHVEMYDATTGELLDSQDVDTTTPATVNVDLSTTAPSEVLVTMSYKVSENLSFFAFSQTIASGATALLKTTELKRMAEKMPLKK